MPNFFDRTIYVLSGPTAVGKTDVALAWAEKFEAEIISCDSLLFYRGMDLGTAKPSAAEMKRVPHHLIDVCTVSERMDVTVYVRKALQAVEEILSRGRRVLVVGGSGFYLKSFFAPIADDIAVDEKLRAELAEKLVKSGLPALVNELRVLNPGGINNLDTDNPRRVVRALERCRATGRTLVDLAEAFARQTSPFSEWPTQLTLLDRESAELSVRVEQRVQAMISNGLADEVKTLLVAGLRENPSASRAIGYRETIAFLDGEITAEQWPASIVKNTQALIKKQRTWFRTQVPAHRKIDANSVSMDGLFKVRDEECRSGSAGVRPAI